MHFHAVGWEVVAQHKNEGGLGFRKLDQMNNACLGKLAWSQVLRSKYEVSNPNEYNLHGNYSPIWNDIVRTWNKVAGNGVCSTCNRESINAWIDY